MRPINNIPIEAIDIRIIKGMSLSYRYILYYIIILYIFHLP
jgi:hypothetical protein